MATRNAICLVLFVLLLSVNVNARWLSARKQETHETVTWLKGGFHLTRVLQMREAYTELLGMNNKINSRDMDMDGSTRSSTSPFTQSPLPVSGKHKPKIKHHHHHHHRHGIPPSPQGSHHQGTTPSPSQQHLPKEPKTVIWRPRRSSGTLSQPLVPPPHIDRPLPPVPGPTGTTSLRSTMRLTPALATVLAAFSLPPALMAAGIAILFLLLLVAVGTNALVRSKRRDVDQLLVTPVDHYNLDGILIEEMARVYRDSKLKEQQQQQHVESVLVPRLIVRTEESQLEDKPAALDVVQIAVEKASRGNEQEKQTPTLSAPTSDTHDDCAYREEAEWQQLLEERLRQQRQQMHNFLQLVKGRQQQEQRSGSQVLDRHLRYPDASHETSLSTDLVMKRQEEQQTATSSNGDKLPLPSQIGEMVLVKQQEQQGFTFLTPMSSGSFKQQQQQQQERSFLNHHTGTGSQLQAPLRNNIEYLWDRDKLYINNVGLDTGQQQQQQQRDVEYLVPLSRIEVEHPAVQLHSQNHDLCKQQVKRQKQQMASCVISRGERLPPQGGISSHSHADHDYQQPQIGKEKQALLNSHDEKLCSSRQQQPVRQITELNSSQQQQKQQRDAEQWRQIMEHREQQQMQRFQQHQHRPEQRPGLRLPQRRIPPRLGPTLLG